MSGQTEIVYGEDVDPDDISWGESAVDPLSGEFVLGPRRVGHINGHEIIWEKKEGGELLNITCDRCEQGIELPQPVDNNTIKALHGYFYSNKCDGTITVVNTMPHTMAGVSNVRNP